MKIYNLAFLWYIPIITGLLLHPIAMGFPLACNESLDLKVSPPVPDTQDVKSGLKATADFSRTLPCTIDLAGGTGPLYTAVVLKYGAGCRSDRLAGHAPVRLEGPGSVSDDHDDLWADSWLSSVGLDGIVDLRLWGAFCDSDCSLLGERNCCNPRNNAHHRRTRFE